LFLASTKVSTLPKHESRWGHATDRSNLLKRAACVLALVVSLSLPLAARLQSVTFKIPPVKIPLSIKEQPVSITASGMLVWTAKDRNLNILNLELDADLTDLQQNMTELMSSELDKSDRCADRIAIQNATLSPIDPASRAIVQLHYERWACVKVFHKEEAKRVLGGNAVIQMKLTPAIEENNTELRLVPEVESIEADHSLGELLRSGEVGNMIREKIRKAILDAMQKGTDLAATLPPAAQGYATIQKAEFKATPKGGLMVVLGGQVRITDEQIQELSKQLKERVGNK
jgi:hypothetical protein